MAVPGGGRGHPGRRGVVVAAAEALVLLGPRAPRQIRDEAFGILDRLRFHPSARPGWKSTP
jgi:hypothetical protein